MEGTPQFMAPEIFEEKYTEKADIYAFGMCVIEMVTQKFPYEECGKNNYQIFKNIMARIKPKIYDEITDDEVRTFIELCLLPEEQRPSARELLNHPFLTISTLPRSESCGHLFAKDYKDLIMSPEKLKIKEDNQEQTRKNTQNEPKLANLT